MQLPFASNLFSTTTLANDWQVIDPPDFTSNWTIQPDGTVTQSVPVGTRKQGSGTLAVLNGSHQASNHIELSMTLPSLHQMGLVFNFMDADDFCLFLVDRKGVNFDGYELKIYEVRSGTAKTICTEKYASTPQDPVSLELDQQGASISFKFTGEVIYEWDNKNLGFGRVGLYSYKSEDGMFNSLTLQMAEMSFGEVAPVYGVVEDTSGVKENPKKVNEDLVRFLEIQKPESKTTIDFKEVYSVPLDEYYQSILNTYDLSSEQGGSGNTKSIVEYLDIRTKRWYRLYDDYKTKLKYANKDLEIANNKVNNVLGKIDAYLDPEKESNENLTLEELERDLEIARASVAHRKNRIYKYRDSTSTLLREIRTSGYDVKEDTKIGKILESGYDFQIDKAVNESKYKPIIFKEKLWFGEDAAGEENWSKIEAELSLLLLEKDLLNTDYLSRYLQEKSFLGNLESNLDVQGELNKIKELISELNIKKLSAEYSIGAYKEALRYWDEDLNKIVKVKNYFETKYPTIQYSSGRSLLSTSDYLSYFEEVVDWLDGKVEIEAVKITNHSESYEDPGVKFKNPYQGNGYSFGLGIGISNAHGYVRLYEIPSLDIASPSGKIKYTINGLNVLSFILTERIEATGNSGVKLGELKFLLALKGDKSGPYKTGIINWDYSDPVAHDLRTPAYRIHGFFQGAIDVCQYRIDLYNGYIAGNRDYIVNLENQISEYNRQITAMEVYGLHKKRLEFLAKWNNPETNGTGSINRKPIFPTSDPLAEFIIETSNSTNDINREVMFFQPTSSGFYNQLGQSLENFISKNTDSNTVIVLPYFDDSGGISDEVIQVVRNPVPSTKSPGMPTIKLVEYYTLEVGWQGFALGELSHSFNLFPGESKELVVEKSTKKTTKISEKVGREEARKQTATSSFEDNLKNELSSGQKDSQESDLKSKDAMSSKSLDKSSSTDDISSSQDMTETSDRSWEVKAKADANWGWGSAEISGGMSGKSSLNRNTKSARKSTWNTSNEDAYEISKSTEGQLKSNQSTEVMRKNLSNSVSKVASETSINNKLEFSSSSSEEYQEEFSNKEVIKLENPNIGKTINYNFFQVQNIYGTATRINDVKIVVDSGRELIDKTGINDVKVYEIEEFGKIFCNSDGSERSAIIASIIARKVLNHYANIPPLFSTGNGSLVLSDGVEVDQESLKIIKYLGGEACRAHHTDTEGQIEPSQIELLKSALHYLKTLPFEFKDTILDKDVGDSRIYVNVAAYHVESQLGYKKATEEYLEARRDIETRRQDALVNEINKRVEDGVYFNKIPSSVNALTISNSDIEEKRRDDDISKG